MTYNAEPQSSQSSPIVQTIRPGVELLNEEVGIGEIVKKHAFYQIRLRMWLSRGEAVRWSTPFGLMTRSRVEDDGTTLITEVRIDRVFLFAGLFYGVQGMRVGGTLGSLIEFRRMPYSSPRSRFSRSVRRTPSAKPPVETH